MKKEGSGSVGTQAVEERHRRSGVVLVRFVKGTLLKQEAEVTGGVNNVRRGGERRRSGLLGNPALQAQSQQPRSLFLPECLALFKRRQMGLE